MRELIAALKLIRPLNGLVAALSVAPAATIACGQLTLPWREAALIFFLVSFGYAVNDIFDLRADLINRPTRAIPSGVLSLKNAWLAAVLSLIAGSGFLIGAGTATAVYYVVVALFLYLYAAKISAKLVLGNLLVAAMCASVFLLGALVCRPSGRSISILVVSGILTFAYHLGREIIKDIEDMSGDQAIARLSLPLKWGPDRARIVAMVIFGALIVLTYAAYWVLGLGTGYLATISMGVNLPLVLIFVNYMRQEAKSAARRTSLALKVIMLPALLAILLAGVN